MVGSDRNALRRELSQAETELDNLTAERYVFMAEHEPPYEGEVREEFQKLNELVLGALDKYYKIKHKL